MPWKTALMIKDIKRFNARKGIKISSPMLKMLLP